MALNPDPVSILNLILAATILVLGIWIFEKKKEDIALYVAAGFGLFAVSHAFTILGYASVHELIIPIRAAGYLAVIIGLCVVLLRTQKIAPTAQRLAKHQK